MSKKENKNSLFNMWPKSFIESYFPKIKVL